MTDQEEEQQSPSTPPYFSGTTFFNFVEAHRRTQPTRIDRSIMGNVAGGDQAKILRALRFFDLTRESGTPTPTFEALKELEGEELQAAWSRLLRNAYPYLFSDFNLEKATQGEIEERFREQGIKGDTVRKAVTFFITMARLAGLKLSPYFKATRQRGTRATRPTRRAPRPSRSAGGSDNGGSASPSRTESEPASQGQSAKTVTFRSGGTATLLVSVDVVNLSPADRKALFAWIDAMSEYESGLGETSGRPG